ncbi:hypothetical protein CABS01_07355 [Colletotrichum abscissum]|uniref:uncharacterized protein n=1 Tax=Colletotrichum abscissum TaxID=1671311 RepID=UPI0027D4CC00|nr:uncharacterized protein CABS01_07355 [Colletotrichum abscissum]KAK1511397.1 hypothetical protein CABS01_07355 [Colletotrichum abscissum]
MRESHIGWGSQSTLGGRNSCVTNTAVLTQVSTKVWNGLTTLFTKLSASSIAFQQCISGHIVAYGVGGSIKETCWIRTPLPRPLQLSMWSLGI